jgi:hypothetical protein
MSIYGKLTKGKDGITYRSQFEANFANKFLFEKFDYEYEKPYNDGTKRKCDFYIKSLDLWIECSYNEVIDTFEYQNIKGNIPLINALYEDRTTVKFLGGRWNPAEKIWYIPVELNTGNRLKKFEKFMSKEYLKIIELDKSQITENYSSDLRQKLYDNIDKRIIIISLKEVDSCNSFNDVLRIVDNEYFKELLSKDEIKNKEKIQSYKKPKETDYDLSFRIFNSLGDGDKSRFIRKINKQFKIKPKKRNKNKQVKFK